jgi:hypothetical protein
MKSFLLAALILAAGFTGAMAETYGVKHNRFCKIEAIVRLTEAILNYDPADPTDHAKIEWDAAVKSEECFDMGLPQPVSIIERASDVMTDPFGNDFVIVKVSEKGWYTWAIKNHNTNLPFGAGA